jgi:apolipoprotein D and lipocalin family protein
MMDKVNAAKALTTFLLITAAMSASAQDAVPDTGVEVDPQAYRGLWYEIARTPAPFQEDCAGGVTAVYEIIDPETVRVLNRCDLPDGYVDSTDGTARVLNDSFNALEVEFPGGPPQQGANYLIEAVGPVEGDQYSWAAVRSPDDDLGWILARTPELDQQARQEAEQALDQSGIDPERLKATEQPPQYYDPRQ